MERGVVGYDLQKQRLSIHHATRRQVSPTLTAAAPPPNSSSALLSLRIILTMHNNHTSCLSWTTFTDSLADSHLDVGCEDHTELIYGQRVCHTLGLISLPKKTGKRDDAVVADV